MSSIVAQYMIDHEQDNGRYTRTRRKNTGIIRGTREMLDVPIPSDETSEIEEGPENTGEKEIIKSGYIEMLRTDIIIPNLSKEGKDRLEEATSEQGLTMNVECIEREELEKKYLLPGETFVGPRNKKVTKITIRGIPADYTGLPMLARVDRILGFPDYEAEKPHSS